MDRIRVLGLGNVLMGDDAFGPTVIKVLEARYEFGVGVTVKEIGTPGTNLVPHVSRIDALIVVDTVRAAGRPGEIRLFRGPDIMKHAPAPHLGPHDLGLTEALFSAESSNQAPREVLLVGAIPESVESRIGLSAAIAAAVPVAVERVVAELHRLGHRSIPRGNPGKPDLWWEQPRRA